MRYFIGEHDGIEYPFDRNVYRAYFYWREGNLPRNRSFSIEELKAHIEECKARGQPTHKFELALMRLRHMNGDYQKRSTRQRPHYAKENAVTQHEPAMRGMEKA